MKYTFLFFILILTGCSWFSDIKGSTKVDKTVIVSSQDNIQLEDRDGEVCRTAFNATISRLESSKRFDPLFDFYKKSSRCMDGGFSQGIEGAISKALDQKWDNLKSLKELFDSDSGFRAYFLNNIGCYVSATETHLERVLTKAKNSCPNELKQLCSDISAVSEKALKYSKEQ